MNLATSFYSISSFLQKYYLDPILYDTGYNPVNMATWAFLLILSVIFIFRLLKKIGVMMDKDFVFANIPYILTGALLRVVEDGELITPPLKYFLITPLIYFLVFFMAIVSLYISILLNKQRGYDYKRVYAFAGILWVISVTLILLLRLDIQNGAILLLVPGLAFGFTLLFYYGFRLLYPPIATIMNSMVIFAQMTDATATFIAIDFFGYWEKHVLPKLAIVLTGSGAVMFLLKFVVFIPLLYYLDREFKDKWEFNNFIKFVLITIGLAPGIRDAVRLALGV